MPRIVSLLLVLILLVGGCTTNRATGRKQFNMVGRQQEISLGRQAVPDFVKKLGGEIPSDAIRRYVSEIGSQLAAVSERPKLPWEFKVVDSQVLNAFALPGGKVFISRGLLAKLEDEAMLAGVLGHEIGHTTAKHIGQQMSHQMVLSGAGMVVSTAVNNSDNAWLRVLGAGTQFGGGLYLLKFSRNHELEADGLGLRYMTTLGYHPKGMLRVLQVLQREEKRARHLSIFSTHPAPAERARHIAQHIVRRYPNADVSSKFVFGEERFQQLVVENLAKLPPPRHGTKKAVTKAG